MVISTANNTTIGVYIFANFRMNNSVGAFCAVAFCTNSKILLSLLSV
jgi:hypothetical protein